MAKLVPSQLNLESIMGWRGLQDREQSVVRDQTRALFETIHEAGKQRLRIGEQLVKVRDVLEPHRMFNRYLKACRFSRATAYRMMDDYNAARTILPTPVMRVALMRPNQRLDVKMMKSSPPPKTTDVVVLNEYFDNMAKKTRAKAKLENLENDPDILLKQAFNNVRNHFERLPKGRVRKDWMRNLTAMLLTVAGVAEDASVTPQEIPEGMIAVLGRPRVKRA